MPLSSLSSLTVTPNRTVLELLAGGLGLVLVVLAVLATYDMGRKRGADEARVAAYEAHLDTLAEERKPMAVLIDSLQTTRRRLAMVQKSLDSVRTKDHAASAAAATAAELQRSRTTVADGWITVKTDSGPKEFAVPHEISNAWALERAADSTVQASLAHELQDDALAIAARDKELADAAKEIAEHEAVEANQQEAIRTLERENGVLRKEHAPRLGFLQGVVGGAAAVIVLVAVL